MFSFDDGSSLLVPALGLILKLAKESHLYAGLRKLALAGPLQLGCSRADSRLVAVRDNDISAFVTFVSFCLKISLLTSVKSCYC
jgi:hypothetical protein